MKNLIYEEQTKYRLTFYKRISKKTAFKEFINGNCIRIVPCKLTPLNNSYIDDLTYTLLDICDYKAEIEASKRCFCNYKNGYYLSYYLITDIQKKR